MLSKQETQINITSSSIYYCSTYKAYSVNKSKRFSLMVQQVCRITFVFKPNLVCLFVCGFFYPSPYTSLCHLMTLRFASPHPAHHLNMRPPSSILTMTRLSHHSDHQLVLGDKATILNYSQGDKAAILNSSQGGKAAIFW